MKFLRLFNSYYSNIFISVVSNFGAISRTFLIMTAYKVQHDVEGKTFFIGLTDTGMVCTNLSSLWLSMNTDPNPNSCKNICHRNVCRSTNDIVIHFKYTNTIFNLDIFRHCHNVRENFRTGVYFIFMHASSLIIHAYPLFQQLWLLSCVISSDIHT